MKKIFKLNDRLLNCAMMVGENSKIADIGTDHAYIPIWLMLNNKISTALACDIGKGPLDNAYKNILRYGLSDKIKIRLSDGLLNVKEDEADEIIIAGMGGNVIITILENCNWKTKCNKKFILQPMKYEERLRDFLSNNGYFIDSEVTSICDSKVYTAMKVFFTGESHKLHDYQKYVGKIDLNNLSPSSVMYIEKQIKNLYNHMSGAKHQKSEHMENYYMNIIRFLEEKLNKKGMN